MKQQLTTGSVFDDLELDPGKAEQLKIKAALFDAIIAYIKENDLTQEQAAEIMGVQRSRVGDVCRGKMSGFSIDALVVMAARAGLRPLSIPERPGDLAIRPQVVTSPASQLSPRAPEQQSPAEQE